MTEFTLPAGTTEPPKKLVRVFFDYHEQRYCIDRPFEEPMSDQDNCDNAVKVLIESMNKGAIIPALHLLSNDVPEEETLTDHALINLGRLDVLKIMDIRVYSINTEPKSE
jgi:hypothetical protein